MKRIYLILVVLLASAQCTFSQFNWADYSHSYTDGTFDEPNSIRIITAIKSVNDHYWDDTTGNLLFSPFAKDSAFKAERPSSLILRSVFDTSKVHFVLRGVDEYNANEYEYCVYEYNGRILVPYTTINRFADQELKKSSGSPKMAYLGSFVAPLGKTIVVDVRSIRSKKIISTAAISWKALKPFITSIYTTGELNTFLNKLSRPYESDTQNSQEGKYKISDVDQETGLNKKLKIAAKDNSLIFLLKGKVTSKDQVEYALVKNNKVEVTWKPNDFDNNFVWLNELKPGDYILKIRYAIQPTHITEFQFEIEPAWYQGKLFMVICGILLAGCGGAFIFLMLYLRQKQTTEWAQLNRTKAQLELRSIYAQLNPHFIFNSLSSIQGLVNRKDIDGANRYLADFAQLMREAIVNNNKELTSLQEELRMLDTYLKLEQLRFGFQYKIEVDAEIDTSITEVPTLFLQPLVENAVKHGISGLQQQGKINLNIRKLHNDLLISIHDNGKGFNEQEVQAGYGLKLTKERIALLNKLSNDQFIYMEVKHELGDNGTWIELKFSNWFL